MRRDAVSRQELLLDRDRFHLQKALARTSELAAEMSVSVAELDSRHARLEQLQDWKEAGGFLRWQQQEQHSTALTEQSGPM